MNSKDKIRLSPGSGETGTDLSKQRQGNEVMNRTFDITFESPEWGKTVTVDFFKVDWGEFGSRINHSMGNTNFEEGILRSAVKQNWQNEEEHRKQFLDWLHHRMDTMIQDAIVKTDSGYGISREFIEKSASRAMGYQLAFMFRHARALFTKDDVAFIRDKVIDLLHSNDTMTVQETIREFGDLEELLPKDRHVYVTSDDYLTKEILRGVPERKSGTRYTEEQIQNAYDLVRNAIAERFRVQIEGPNTQ